MSDFDWSEHLRPGERLLWSGRPRGGIFIGDFGHDFGLVAAGAFGLFWMGAMVPGAHTEKEALIFFGVGIVFILIALYPFIRDRRERRSAQFAITNERALSTKPNAGVMWIDLETTIQVRPQRHLIFFGTKRSIPIATAPGSFWQRRHFQYSLITTPQYRGPGGNMTWISFPDIENGFELAKIAKSRGGKE